MKKILLLLALLFAVRASAQTQTIVTGTIQTPAGTLATSGTVTFTLRPSSASLLYYVSGLNVIAPTVGTCGINGSGVLQNLALSGNCLVWGNDVITPANTTYDVQFYPNGQRSQLIHQLLISGISYSLSNPVFTNSVQINPQYTTVFAAPTQANIVPISDNVFNVGGPGARYAAGYFANLFVTNSMAFGQLTATTYVQVAPTLVGSLPSAASAAYQWRTVSDSTAVASEGQTCVGGSTNKAAVFSNGVVWKCF